MFASILSADVAITIKDSHRHGRWETIIVHEDYLAPVCYTQYDTINYCSCTGCTIKMYNSYRILYLCNKQTFAFETELLIFSDGLCLPKSLCFQSIFGEVTQQDASMVDPRGHMPPSPIPKKLQDQDTLTEQSVKYSNRLVTTHTLLTIQNPP